jgi:CelD/BcsL family acetyltransferase involved in cellulose biosynthesis
MLGELVDDVEQLRRWEADWDRLALARSRPFSAPAWMVAWWTHAAPAGASLKVVIIRDGRDVVGVAPMYITRRTGGIRECRLLAGDTCFRVEPLARPGAEATVASAVADVLAGSGSQVDLMTFDGVPADSPWPELMTRAWPRGGTVIRERTMPAPIVTMASHDSYEDWFASRSRNFRQQINRTRRHLREAGAIFRLADPAELDAAIEAFAALHRSRWDWRGGSSTLDGRVERMLRSAGRRMMRDLRLRIWTLDVGGRTISSHIFLAAGGEVSYWLGGFDEAWARYHPGLQVLVSSLEHAWSTGDRRVDLGGGGQAYKYRLADGEDSLSWVHVIPSGPRSGRVRALLASRTAYRSLRGYVPAPLATRLKTVLDGRRGTDGRRGV